MRKALTYLKHLALAVVLVLTSCGCASGRVNPITGTPAGAGTYAYEVSPSSVTVNADTLRGGPRVEYKSNPDGSVDIVVDPSRERLLQDILPLLTQ